MQKYVDTPSNLWIWLFQPHLLLTPVYNWVHSHAISLNKRWQWNGLTEELNYFQRGTVLGCHLSNKLVCQISALLELLRSTVSVVIVKWKCLGATTAQLRSDRPHKLIEWERRVLKRVARKNKYRLTTFKLPLEVMSAQELLAEQPHTSLRSLCAMPSIGWSAVKLATIELWISGNAFF
jgi:hypothetical protein